MSERSWASWRGETLLCEVRLTPRAARDRFGVEAGRLRLRVTSPPLEGRANKHASEFLARLFGVPVSRVRLLRGEKHRDKLFAVDRPQRMPAELRAGLAQALQSSAARASTKQTGSE